MVYITGIRFSMDGISFPNLPREFSKTPGRFTLKMEPICRHHYMVLFLDFGLSMPAIKI